MDNFNTLAKIIALSIVGGVAKALFAPPRPIVPRPVPTTTPAPELELTEEKN